MTDEVAAKVDKFFSRYPVRKYAKGQIILLSGEVTDYVYQLLDGQVKQYDVSYRGDEVVLNIFHPPAFFPMSLAINKKPNQYIYEAETAIEIRQAPAEKAVAFVKDNPDVMFDLLERLYSGMDGILGRMVHLMSGTAKSRLLYELLVEGRRFGVIQADGSCLIKATEKDLGARAGMSRETVSREIHKLKAQDLVASKGPNLVIKDIKLLEQKLGQGL